MCREKFTCPCWVYALIVSVIFVAIGSAIGFGVQFGGSDDVIVATKVDTNINDTNISEINVGGNNLTDAVDVDQGVVNVAKPTVMNNSSSNAIIQNNVSLTNLNNFKIFIQDTARNNEASLDTKHEDTVNKLTEHVTNHFNGVSKQILDYTLIIFAILTTAVLIYCAIRFTKKQGKSNIVQDQQKLSDIQASMQQIQEQLDNIQSTVDLIE